MKTLNGLLLTTLMLLGAKCELIAQCPETATPECPNCPNCPLDYESCDSIPPYTPKVNVIISGFWRIVSSNGIPDHPIGMFPLVYEPEAGLTADERALRRTEEVCCGRPTGMTEQMHVFVMPAYPGERKAMSLTSDKYTFWLPVPGLPVPTVLRQDGPAPFGVAVNGIPLDPAAAEWWDGNPNWSMNPLKHPLMESDLDCNNGHVQPNGAYHYHGFPEQLYENSGGEWPVSNQQDLNIVQLGWAFDGAEIYGPVCFQDPATSVLGRNWIMVESAWTEKSGARPGAPAGPGGTYSTGEYVEDYEATRGTYDDDPSGRPVYLDQCNGHVNPDFLDGEYHYHITTTFPYIPRCYSKIVSLEGRGI